MNPHNDLQRFMRLREQFIYMAQFYMDKVKESPEKIHRAKELIGVTKDLMAMVSQVNELADATGLTAAGQIRIRARYMKLALAAVGHRDGHALLQQFRYLCSEGGQCPSDEETLEALEQNGFGSDMEFSEIYRLGSRKRLGR